MTVQIETNEGPGTDEARALLKKAQSATTHDERMDLAADAFTEQLLHAMKRGKVSMKAKKISKPDAAIGMLRAAGLDKLLVEGFVKGKITYKQADEHLTRMRDDLQNRRVAADEIKYGIIAFDGLAQRLAMVGGKKGPFEYPTRNNHARDSLLTFARALHR